jgi:hypothetical protein
MNQLKIYQGCALGVDFIFLGNKKFGGCIDFKFVNALESDIIRGVILYVFVVKWHMGLTKGVLALASTIIFFLQLEVGSFDREKHILTT